MTETWWTQLWDAVGSLPVVLIPTSSSKPYISVADIAVPVYSSANYGTIPTPGSSGFPTISQAAPQTQAQLTEAGAWTPEESASVGLDQGKQAQIDYINSKIDDGSYNPNGNLPFSASSLSDLLDKYGTVVLIAGCVGVFLILKEMR